MVSQCYWIPKDWRGNIKCKIQPVLMLVSLWGKVNIHQRKFLPAISVSLRWIRTLQGHRAWQLAKLQIWRSLLNGVWPALQAPPSMGLISMYCGQPTWQWFSPDEGSLPIQSWCTVVSSPRNTLNLLYFLHRQVKQTQSILETSQRSILTMVASHGQVPPSKTFRGSMFPSFPTCL